MENVKNLLGKKHRHNFNEWFKVLEGMGYKSYYKVLNAKDYGIPQNRERVFCVSILGGGQYLFPNPIPLEKRLKDMLEEKVSEKYYLSDEQVYKFIKSPFHAERDRLQEKDYCDTILSRDWKGPKLIKEPQVLTPKRTEYGKKIRKDYESGKIHESRHNMTYMEPRKDGISNTLTSVQKDNYVIEPLLIKENTIKDMWSVINYRIRKLTPREYWRLMGVKDNQFDRLHGISKTNLYKLAGNSIVVDVLEAIFKNLIMPETTDTKGQLSLF